MYLVAADLLDRFGSEELAQVAPPDELVAVEPALMRAVIQAEDTSAWTADEIQAATEGVARIDEALSDASEEVDGYLASRYTLPLDPVPGFLVRLTGNIARYYLHDDRASEEIEKRYRDSVKTLTAIADGKVSLGSDDPSPEGPGPIGTKSDCDRQFTKSSLADF